MGTNHDTMRNRPKNIEADIKSEPIQKQKEYIKSKLYLNSFDGVLTDNMPG